MHEWVVAIDVGRYYQQLGIVKMLVVLSRSLCLECPFPLGHYIHEAEYIPRRISLYV